MWNRITNLFKEIASGCIVIFLFYFAIASVVFSLRHPWATRTEQMIHIGDALSTRDSLLRVVATDPDSNSEFTLVADDQYSIRQNKIGYFGSLEEGRVILDVRALVGKIV